MFLELMASPFSNDNQLDEHFNIHFFLETTENKWINKIITKYWNLLTSYNFKLIALKHIKLNCKKLKQEVAERLLVLSSFLDRLVLELLSRINMSEFVEPLTTNRKYK